MNRINQLQELVKANDSLHISAELLDYSGIVAYHPEELVITVKAGTKVTDINKELAKNNQAFSFYIEDGNKSIGSMYANGSSDFADSVLGVKLIDGNADLLNFGGQVMKNVAGYDVARLLVGSKGKMAMITEISFKVMPKTYVGNLTKPSKNSTTSDLHKSFAEKLKLVFDPKNIFN